LLGRVTLSFFALFVAPQFLLARQDPLQEFRLPPTARPVSYKLDLTIRPEEATFRGIAVIAVELKERVQVVWLNAKDLSIREIRVQSGATSGNCSWRTSGEFLAIELREPMGPGTVQLEIHYIAAMDDKTSVGAYRKKSANDWYVYTSFTPIDARRAFPCFDEPEYKVPWTIVLHVKRDHLAVSNAPVTSTEEEPDGMKRVEFAPTQPLPSEVIAFAVGPFDVVDVGVAGQKHIPVRVITPRAQASEAGPASKVTAEVLPLLEQYTGIAYPWDKLDHLAVLEMSFGATENPGLITYRADELLAAPTRDTPQRQEAMRSTMTHEMAHQWFGNLVTQSWWDDVWLSEGFATWLEIKIADAQLPLFERGLMIAGLRNHVLLSNSFQRRPVRVQVHNRKETDAVYDSIVYLKGAGILQMLEDWIGPEELQHSLHRYLTDHAFKTANSHDLVSAITQETGIDAGPVLFDFLDRRSAPKLRFSLQGGGGSEKLIVEQSAKPWTVPVCIHVENTKPHCELVSASRTELLLSGQPRWVWPNAYGSGYYRSTLTGALFDRLMKDGYSELHGPERLALTGDLEGLTDSGDVPASSTMNFLPQIARDPDPRIRVRALATALELSLLAADTSRPKYRQWLQKTMNVPTVSPTQTESFEEFFRDKRLEGTPSHR
jgi:alanyl aminopeptidase